ncbi:MAG: cyclodeaminase/cyclohydrolase family protein [Candidatus Riflebacteria bacterium]|nr:cyclodeaminase/cyclohydrolase family protein [Candidatus Riflebacteria bacterium]
MNPKTLSNTLSEFNQAVASNSFAPGGGCVSALSGSLGAALGRMVLSLTIGKKKYLEFDAENKVLAGKLEEIHNSMLGCVEKDISGCNAILEAMNLPKDTETEKSQRKSAMSEAAKKANEAPIEICHKSVELLRVFKNSISKVNRNTITDWACGALQAYAALEGASMNAKINLGGINDPRYIKDTQESLRSLIGEGRSLFEEIKNQVHSCLDESN